MVRLVRQRIERGELLPGDELPRLAELAELAELAGLAYVRPARRAVEVLIDEGLVEHGPQGRPFRVAVPVEDGVAAELGEAIPGGEPGAES